VANIKKTPNGSIRMSEYKHGSMSIVEHEKTFKGFLKLGRVLIYVSIGVLVFLAVFNS